MEQIGVHEVSFLEPLHTALFIMSVENKRYVDVNEQLICLYFSIEVKPLLLVEREKNTIRIWF